MPPPPPPRAPTSAMAQSQSQNTPESRRAAMLQAWADGKATLKDVRGYSDEELFSVAHAAHTYFYQGRINEARTLFHGLFAIDPGNAYFARALGVATAHYEKSEEALIREFLAGGGATTRGIGYERLERDGWARVDVPSPYLPFADVFGFVALPLPVLATIVLIAALYVAATEVQKHYFYRRLAD